MCVDVEGGDPARRAAVAGAVVHENLALGDHGRGQEALAAAELVDARELDVPRDLAVLAVDGDDPAVRQVAPGPPRGRCRGCARCCPRGRRRGRRSRRTRRSSGCGRPSRELVLVIEAELQRQDLTDEEAGREAGLSGNALRVLRHGHRPKVDRADELCGTLRTTMTLGVDGPSSDDEPWNT